MSITVDYMKTFTAIDYTKREATFVKLYSPIRNRSSQGMLCNTSKYIYSD